MLEYNGLTIGFHGCEKALAKEVLLNRRDLVASSNIFNKNHIQICIRNVDCIMGYFLPKELGISL